MSDEPPNYRDSDPETSKEAGENAARNARAIEVKLLRDAYRKSLADADRSNDPWEAWIHDADATVLAGYSLARDGARRRCSTLRSKGLIEPLMDPTTGKLIKRPSKYTNANRMVCRITIQGLDLLDSVE